MKLIFSFPKEPLKPFGFSIIYERLSQVGMTDMTQDRQCKGCQHHNTCDDMYRRLGHSQAPPVTVHVLVAFVMPLIVFVFSLAGAQKIWSALAYPQLITLMSFLSALAATALLAGLGAWWLRSARNK